MKLASLSLVLPLALSLAAGVAAQSKQVKPSSSFQEAAGTPADAPKGFEFEMNGFSYHVAANGNGWRMKRDKTRRFNLHLGGGEDVRRLYFSDYEGDLLLLCEVEGGEDVGAVITRLEQPSMRARWKQDVPSGNINVLRDEGSLYLAGTNFVARLDLKTGGYVWRHVDKGEDEESKDLIPSGRYSVPELSGDIVTFNAARGPDATRPRVVRVNRKSGKIISIE
ncbi:MAG: hypothetical protein QOJ70_2998 [Acidobacteriota bacterium]|jgi:hypothetical protein|nr:hypothetical protein [Acidobacteriota bacterium]MDT7809185.1 hypothetical protein [Acidobacteriota bacterium]